MSRTLYLFALVLLAFQSDARAQDRKDAYGDPLPGRALTRIATPDARMLLTRWASGDPFAVLTQEAARAVKGMK
jgi:hypothetical protein